MTDESKPVNQGPTVQDFIGGDVTTVKIGDVLDSGVYTESKILNGAETFTSKGSIGAEVSVSVIAESGVFNGLQVRTQTAASLNAPKIGTAEVSVDSSGVVSTSIGRSLGAKGATASAGIDSTGNLEAKLGIPVGMNQTGGVYGRINPFLGVKLIGEVATNFTGASFKALTMHIDGRINSGAGMTIRDTSFPGWKPDGDSIGGTVGDLDKFRKQPVAPSPQLTYGNNRDKSPLPGGTPSGTPLSFGPPPPAGGKTPPPAWTQPNLPLSMGTPVSDRGSKPPQSPFRGPMPPQYPLGKPPQYPLGVPVSGGGLKPAAPVQPKLMPNPSSSNRDRQDGPRESASDRPDDPRFSAGGSGNRNSGGGGGTGGGNSGGGGSGGSGSGSGGGGYVNNGNNPGNKNAPGYNGSSSNTNGGGYVNNGNNPGNKNAPGYNGSGNQNNNNNNNNKNVGNGPARDTSRTGAARPIILDLGGDGFDVSFTGTARFDMDGDGFRERVGWADAQDALLVLDLNADGSRGAGDGKIDQAKEVVLSLWGDAGMTDMEAVAKARDASGNLAFDTNGDGKLTAADAAWREFRVWQDADQDGVTDAGELKTLDQMGFTEIGLTYDDGSSYAETSDDVIIRGETLDGAASYVRSRWRLTASIDGIFFREFIPFGGVNRIELWSC